MTNVEQKRRGASPVIVGLLIVLTSLVFTLAVSAAWTRRTLFNTDQYVRTVGPLVENPSVTRALSDRIVAELLLVVDAESLVEEALPPRAQILAGPIIQATDDFVTDEVRTLLDSERFAELWANANRFAHTQIMAVLQGEGNAILTTDRGTVALNLLPVINEALVRVEERASGVLGNDIDLPVVSSGEVPEAAHAKLEAALGVQLPDDLGQIVIFQSDKLAAAQTALTWIDRSVIFLLIASALLIALTLWVSGRRRRTLVQLSTGILVGLVLVRRLVILAQNQAVDLVRPENEAAARAIVDDLMTNFFRLTTLLIVLGVAVIVAAVLTGPSAWATRARAETKNLVAGVTNWTRERTQDDATTEWVQGHSDGLKIGFAIALVITLLVFDVSWVGFIVLTAIVGVLELAVYRLSRAEPSGTHVLPH